MRDATETDGGTRMAGESVCRHCEPQGTTTFPRQTLLDLAAQDGHQAELAADIVDADESQPGVERLVARYVAESRESDGVEATAADMVHGRGDQAPAETAALPVLVYRHLSEVQLAAETFGTQKSHRLAIQIRHPGRAFVDPAPVHVHGFELARDGQSFEARRGAETFGGRQLHGRQAVANRHDGRTDDG